MKMIIGLILLAAAGLFAWYYFTKTEDGTVAEKAREAARELGHDVKEKTHDIAAKIEEKTRSSTSAPASGQ